MAENKRENIKRWRQDNPEKVRAHSILNEALSRGKIDKPMLCEHCNQEKPLQGHHEDYSKPLEVIWLCSSCHHELHKSRRTHKPIKLYIKKGYNNKGKSKPYKKPLYFNKAKELREQGKSYKEISDVIGISKGQIFKWLNNPDYN